MGSPLIPVFSNTSQARLARALVGDGDDSQTSVLWDSSEFESDPHSPSGSSHRKSEKMCDVGLGSPCKIS